MIYKISPDPSLPKRGKDRGTFPKRERKSRYDPLDLEKTKNNK
jgi:hypothetical protein